MVNLSQLAGTRVYLETNAFIYAFEAENRWTAVLRALFDLADRGKITGVTSELTIAEVLVGPLMASNQTMIERYTGIFAAKGVLELVPVGRHVLEEAASIRARTRLKLFDAIHVASAASCEFLLTNDDAVAERSSNGLPLRELVVD